MGNMVPRLSGDDSELLRATAEREHRCMHDANSAVRDYLHDRQARREQIMADFDSAHGELLERLSK